MQKSFRSSILRLFALALCTFAVTSVSAFAQGGGGGGRMGGGPMSPEAQKARFDSMKAAVGLTDDQVAKIKAINADSMKQMMALRDAGGTPEENRPKMMALRQDEQTKIRALLTDDQKTKYDTWLQSQPRPGRGGPGGPGGGTPPPPPPPQL